MVRAIAYRVFIGGLLMPRLRHGLSRDQTLSASTITYAIATAILAEVKLVAAAHAAMCLGGAAWVIAMTSLNVTAQLVVPQWVKAGRVRKFRLGAAHSFASPRNDR